MARGLPGPLREVALPGTTLHRAGDWDLVAAGVGPALAAAGAATALTAAALDGRPYGLVVSAGIGGGFAPGAPVGSLVVADEITAADLGAETADGFLPVTELGFGTVTHRPPAGLVRRVADATGARPGTVLALFMSLSTPMGVGFLIAGAGVLRSIAAGRRQAREALSSR
ncbi:Futalosine hydrolase [Streptomyces fumanus]